MVLKNLDKKQEQLHSQSECVLSILICTNSPRVFEKISEVYILLQNINHLDPILNLYFARHIGVLHIYMLQASHFIEGIYRNICILHSEHLKFISGNYTLSNWLPLNSSRKLFNKFISTMYNCGRQHFSRLKFEYNLSWVKT